VVMPFGLQEGEASRISGQSSRDGGAVVSPTHRPLLSRRKYRCYSFPLEAGSTPRPYFCRQN